MVKIFNIGMIFFMEDSAFIDNISQELNSQITKATKVSYFIITIKLKTIQIEQCSA